MSIKLTTERKQELAQEVRDLLMNSLTAPRLPRVKGQGNREALFVDAVYNKLYKLHTNSSDYEEVVKQAVQLCFSYLLELRLFKELTQNAKKQTVYFIAPNSNLSAHDAFVFEDNTAILKNNEEIEIHGERTPVSADFNSSGLYFESDVLALEWRVRSLGHIVNQYPKQKDYKTYLVNAEQYYQAALTKAKAKASKNDARGTSR